MRRARTTLTTIAALAITTTAAAQPVPTILPQHANQAERGWPHQATRGELREAILTVHRYTRLILLPNRRAIRTTCWTGKTGVAGRYACRIRNQKGGIRGVPRILRAAVLRVWEDGSWELTYRGRIPGGLASVTYTQAKNGRASSARYTPVHCCTVNRGR